MLREVLADMQATVRAHEQWAMSPDAFASEAGASMAFVEQIRRWMQMLESSQSSDAVDPHADSTGTPPTRDGSASSESSHPPAAEQE